jgi:hypothetical protein
MTPRRILFIVATLTCLLLAACGDSKSTTTASGSNDNSSSGATTASGDSSGDGTTVTFKGSGSGGFCDYAKDIESSKALEDAFGANQDPKAIKSGFSKALDIMNTAAGKAPSEIKADMQTVQNGFKKINDLYAKYDYDISKLTAAMAKDPTIASQADSLTSGDFAAASDRVDQYLQQVCKVSTS